MIGDKWNPYVKIVAAEKNKMSKQSVSDDIDIDYIDVNKGDKVEKSVEGEVLDKLGLHKYCCRRMFLGNVHLISYI
tara:strand:+ start:78 stop:305 length:228 start_codon:yes stop_codon:yes gene_type:complete